MIALLSQINIMQDDKNKNSEPTPENIQENAKYDPKNRDFQRTEDDIDDVSASEKEELEKRKERLEKASTTPNENRIG